MLPFAPIPLNLVIIALLCGLLIFGLINVLKAQLSPTTVAQWQHWRDTSQTAGQMLARLYRAFIVIGLACIALGLITAIQFHQMTESQDRYLKALQSSTQEQAQISRTNASPYDCVGHGKERRCVMELVLINQNQQAIDQEFYLAPGIRLSQNQVVTLSKTAHDHYVLIEPEPLLMNDKVIAHYSQPIYLGLLLAAIGWSIRWGRDRLLNQD